MSLSIQNLSEEDRGGHKNILIYSPSGKGKTHLAATAVQVEEMCPILLVSAEDKLESVMNVDGYEDIDIVTFEKWEDLNDLYEMIEKDDYNTIIVDSLTRIQERAIEFIQGRESDQFKFDGDMNSPSRNDWGKIIDLTIKFVREFNKLDANLIYTALQDREKDDRTGKITVEPSFAGKKTSSKVCASMDIVGNLITYEKDGEIKRGLKVQSTGKEVVNDTTNKLGSGLKDDPDFKEIWQKITK